MVSITVEQVVRGCQEIRRQEEMQRRLGEVVDPRQEAQQTQKKDSTTTGIDQKSSTPSSPMQTSLPAGTQKKKRNDKGVSQHLQQSMSKSSPEPEQTMPPTPVLNDDEPDRL